MSKQIVLTGITTTGTPHIGNYLGAIKPAIAASQQPNVQSYYFLADYHALIKCHDPERISASTRAIAATWIALGLDTERATFYRQSDIPEIAELTWILTCHTAKGLMNRAHAYKASVDQNRESGQEDLDDGINMGLFSYPILMAADILMFKANRVPVGKDQAQHIEMARDIASRFNHQFAPLLTLPEAQIDSDTQLIPGLDGRKMSKSYDNTLPLFAEPDELYRLIKLIKTDSKAPGEPKQTEHNTLFQLFSFFGSETETEAYRKAFANGIAWGDAKKQLFECIDAYLAKPRERYKDLLHNLDTVENILQAGAAKARAQSHPLMQDIRAAVGIRPLTSQAVKVTPTHSKKEKSADELAKLEAGRQRAILLQLQPQLEAIAAANDPKAMALSLLKTKQLEIDTLKKKAKQKAENELAVLQNALSDYLS